jgi:hypothetical protein
MALASTDEAGEVDDDPEDRQTEGGSGEGGVAARESPWGFPPPSCAFGAIHLPQSLCDRGRQGAGPVRVARRE